MTKKARYFIAFYTFIKSKSNKIESTGNGWMNFSVSGGGYLNNQITKTQIEADLIKFYSNIYDYKVVITNILEVSYQDLKQWTQKN